MKVWKQFVKNIGVSRRKSGSPSSSSPSSTSKDFSPSRKRRATTTMKDAVVIACSITEAETSHRSLTSFSSSSDAPWRVERIRVGAPGEADWWKDDDAMDATTTEDDTWNMSSSGGVSESMDESIVVMENGKKLEKSSSSTSSTGTDGSPKKFHNCGLETWEAARAAWTAKPENNSRSTSSMRVRPINQRELGKILSKASSLRTYELPRRTPLKDLVESYVSVWNGDL